MPVKSFCLGFTISERTKVYTEEITPDSLVLKIDNVFAIPVSAKLDVKIENLNVVSGSQLFAVVPANTLGFILGYYKKKDSSAPYRISYQWKIVLGDITLAKEDNYFYDYPFFKGNNYKITQGPGGSISHKHTHAYDFAMPVGTPVTAAREGVIALLKFDSNVGGADKKYIEAANFISVYHSDGTIANYVHLNTNGVLVKEGQRVKKGEVIGYSGNTGFSSGPHLHFELTKPGGDFGKNQSIVFNWEPRTNGLFGALFRSHNNDAKNQSLNSVAD